MLRPWNREEQDWDTTRFPDAINLASTDEDLETKVQTYLHHGTPVMGRIQLVGSKKSERAILRALKMMNPFHQKDESTVAKWHKLLLGQDLCDHATDKRTNIFGERYNPIKDLDRIQPPMNDEQRSFIEKTLTDLPNDLAIIQGGAGTGKTRVDLVTALLMVQTKKVLFVGPTNASVDDYAIKLADLCEKSGSQPVKAPCKELEQSSAEEDVKEVKRKARQGL
jgi:hypothetical protein